MCLIKLCKLTSCCFTGKAVPPYFITTLDTEIKHITFVITTSFYSVQKVHLTHTICWVLLILFYFIYQVVGLVVGLSGFYLLMKYKQSNLFFSDSYITLTAIFALASTAFLLVSGCLGSWLSFRDSTFLQGLVRLWVCVWMQVSVCVSVFRLYLINFLFFSLFIC